MSLLALASVGSLSIAVSSRTTKARDAVTRTFVRGAGRRLEHDLSRVAGFTEQAEAQGLEAGAEILAAAEQPAPPHVAEALAIAVGAPVIRLERVRSGDGRAVTLEDSCLPAERFPGLLGHDLGGSVYTLMRDEYGLAPVEAVERLEAVSARAHEAEALGVPEGSPLMLVERTAYAAGGVPVEFARDRHRGDRARFVVRVVPAALLGGASRGG